MKRNAKTFLISGGKAGANSTARNFVRERPVSDIVSH